MNVYNSFVLGTWMSVREWMSELVAQFYDITLFGGKKQHKQYSSLS